MAIIYTYPRATNVESSDLLLICDSSSDNKATQTTTIAAAVQSALVQGIELPADDPENSVQFNLGGNLTGIPTFTFVEDAELGQNILSLGASVTADPNIFPSKRGIINLYNRGRIALWAAGPQSNQAVGLTGPRNIATSPGSYEISLPTDDPTLDHTPNPTLPAVPRVLVVDGTDLGGKSFDSKFLAPRDLGISAVGDAFQLQFRKPDTVDENGDTVDNSGMFDATEQLRVIPLHQGSATEITQGLSLSIGSVSRTSSFAPQRGVIRIGSGPINQSGQNDFGGTVLLEYVYPANGPTTGANAAAYSFVGLRAPKYDINTSIAHQDYDLILPQLNPEYSTNNQPYEDASGNNISQILVANPVDASNNNQRFYETKFVSVDNLGIGAGGVKFNVQFNNGNEIDGDNSFNYFVNNLGTGAPASAPRAHELQIGAGGGTLPGMLTLYGDNDPVVNPNGGTAGILRFITSTGTDYATITGPSIQTEIDLTNQGTGYVSGSADSTFETEYVTQDPGNNGTGLTVHIAIQPAGPIQKISIAQQGHSYKNGDVLRIIGGDNNAEITLTNVREQTNIDYQIYDIKLPKYAPGDDKIWFGKGTGKNTELTTSNFFKVREETGQAQSGLPTTGTTLQLQIGNQQGVPVPPGSQAEPYGSILLHGGNNTSEGGSIRFISGGYGTQWVNLIGPPGSSSNNLQPAPNPYSVMLPRWSPDVSETMFPDLEGGVSGLQSPPQGGFGQNYSIANRLLTETDSVEGSGCRVNIVSVDQDGGISNITIHTPGHGYQVGDTLTVVQANNVTADIEITAIEDVVGGKVLVAAVDNWQSQGTNNNKQMKWVAPSDLGISGGSDLVIEDEGNSIANTATSINFKGGGVFAEVPDPNFPNKVDVEVLPRRNSGFSPFPIYQGDSQINVSPLKSKVIGVQTICDVHAGQLTVARIFGSIPDSCRINVAVYEGELYTAGSQATDTTKLITFGSALQGPNPTPLTGIYRINLTTTPVWSPEAGTPIIVVIEIDNTTGAQGLAASILGQAVTTSIGNFANNLSFQVDGSTSIYNHLSPPVSGDKITETIPTGLDPAQERICHHFDPFAP